MIEIPKSYNYISAFLTFRCNLNCKYCINKYNGLHRYKTMGAKEWIDGLNRLAIRQDLPVTISGGEPTTHPDFYKIVKGIDPAIHLDLLTNGEFDLKEFMNEVNPHRLKRNAPYASIRFSYHPGFTNILNLVYKVKTLQKNMYSVGIWAVNNGDQKLRLVQSLCSKLGIDLRFKAFLDNSHGDYKYPHGINGLPKKCLCKPSELLIAPDGRFFRCHYDLYHGVNSYGHLLDKNVELPVDFLPCENYGLCNPCDLKIKYDRFQNKGHCAVEIKEIG